MESSVDTLPGSIGGASEVSTPFDVNAFVAKYGGVVGSKFKAKHVFYTQGEIADFVFYIEKGQAQLTVISAQGKEAVIAILEAGDFCGEGCLVGEPLNMSTATAITECAIARLEKAAVMRAIHDDLAFAEFFIMYVLNRTVRLRDNLIDQLFNSSERRLARVLLCFRSQSGPPSMCKRFHR